MADPKQTIHIRIRDLRRERSLTQEELAEALGISRQSINAMEAGRCLPSLPVALQIAAYFAVPLTTVFTIEEQMADLIQQVQQSESYIHNHITEDSMSNLVPWSPLKEMREALDELMDESVSWSTQPQMSVPAVNVAQTAHTVEVEVRLPGYKKDNLAIEVGEDFISVAGEIRQILETTQKHYVRREFANQSFQRTIPLPVVIHTDRAEAIMKDGILYISLPKLVEEKPKTAKLTIKEAD